MAFQNLTLHQTSFLLLFGKNPLAKEFYFSGGTALSSLYLHHRFSEDLDFFCENEFDPQTPFIFLKRNKTELSYKSIDVQHSFNRNIFHLKFAKNDVLKVEFTCYPFHQIEQTKSVNGVRVDSLIDIAANKLFTIAQQPRGRDYFDLFTIFFSAGWQVSMSALRLLAKQKFDWHIDPLQLGSQFHRVHELLDDPILLKHIDKKEVESFFAEQAKNLIQEVLE